uniref:hypothetical protein n=1 Tax=Streptomyces lushanensis TaxID=1434255 RepID=UPI001B808567
PAGAGSSQKLAAARFIGPDHPRGRGEQIAVIDKEETGRLLPTHAGWPAASSPSPAGFRAALGTAPYGHGSNRSRSVASAAGRSHA